MFIFLSHVLFYNVLQLEDYCINSDQREPLPQQTTSWSESHQRALDLLELEEEQQVNFDMQDVTAEVDRYLAVPTKEIKNSIAYWLVCLHLYFRKHFNLFTRKTNINSQLYLSLQWTSCPYKPPLCPVKGYFPPARKQSQQEETHLVLI